MPEYSSTTITPADGVKTPAMNGSTSGNYTLADLRAFVLASKGLANGLASLDGNGKLPTSQLPDLADDVLVYGSYALLPNPGIAGKLYITADNNKMYRWDDALATPAYVELSVDLSDYATKAEVAEAVEDLEAADSDLKNALDSTNARVENLEQEHGSYQEVTVKSPYTVPSGKAKNWSVNVLRGVTRALNNLCGSPNLRVMSYYTYDATTAIFTLNVSMSSNDKIWVDKLVNVLSHTYLIYATNPTVKVYMDSSSIGNAILYNGASNGYFGIYFESGRTYSNVQTKIVCIDLDVYFNGSIPSDADTIAKIQQNYPELLVPSAYGQSLVSTVYEGVVSEPVGNNLIDEAKFGYISSIDRYGINKKLPAGTYTISGNVATQFATGFIVNGSTTDVTAIYGAFSRTFTLTAEKEFAIWTSNPSAIIDWVMLNVGSSALPYEAYQKSTLSLPTPVTLRSAGTVAEEFDLETGKKTNPLGSAEASTLSWSLYGSSQYIYITTSLASVVKRTSSDTDIGNILSDRVKTTYIDDVYAEHNGIAVRANGQVWYRDGSGNPPSGTIYYEKATPNAPTQLDPIQNPYIATESGGTISSILTDAVDDSMTLGYINL